MTRKEIFNKILNQQFTETFIDSDHSLKDFKYFDFDLNHFTMCTFHAGIFGTIRIKSDFILWLEEQDVFNLKELISQNESVTPPYEYYVQHKKNAPATYDSLKDVKI